MEGIEDLVGVPIEKCFIDTYEHCAGMQYHRSSFVVKKKSLSEEMMWQKIAEHMQKQVEEHDIKKILLFPVSSFDLETRIQITVDFISVCN